MAKTIKLNAIATLMGDCLHSDHKEENIQYKYIIKEYGAGARIKDNLLTVSTDGTVTVTCIASIGDKEVRKDATFTVNKIKKYTITYLATEGGSIDGIRIQNIIQGEDCEPVGVIADYGYHFVDWSDTSTEEDRHDTNIQSSKVYTAKFELNVYKVTFLGREGSPTLLVTQATHGFPPDEVPTDEQLLLDDYWFVKWDKNFNCVEEEMVITAIYKIKEFTVIFFSWDKKELKKEVVQIHQNATAPTPPDKEGYNFKKWSKSYTNVTKDLEVVAEYEIKKFKVKFVDWNDKLLKEETVEWGSTATAPTNVYREGYHFDRWDKEFSNVKSDLTVKAVYEINKYQVVFKSYNGTYNTQTVEWGKAATKPTDPTRTGYTFKGWDKSFNCVKENLTITAQWDIKKFKIKINIIGPACGSTCTSSKYEVEYGQSATITIKRGTSAYISYCKINNSNYYTDELGVVKPGNLYGTIAEIGTTKTFDITDIKEDKTIDISFLEVTIQAKFIIATNEALTQWKTILVPTKYNTHPIAPEVPNIGLKFFNQWDPIYNESVTVTSDDQQWRATYGTTKIVLEQKSFQLDKVVDRYALNDGYDTYEGGIIWAFKTPTTIKANPIKIKINDNYVDMSKVSYSYSESSGNFRINSDGSITAKSYCNGKVTISVNDQSFTMFYRVGRATVLIDANQTTYRDVIYGGNSRDYKVRGSFNGTNMDLISFCCIPSTRQLNLRAYCAFIDFAKTLNPKFNKKEYFNYISKNYSSSDIDYPIPDVKTNRTYFDNSEVIWTHYALPTVDGHVRLHQSGSYSFTYSAANYPVLDFIKKTNENVATPGVNNEHYYSMETVNNCQVYINKRTFNNILFIGVGLKNNATDYILNTEIFTSSTQIKDYCSCNVISIFSPAYTTNSYVITLKDRFNNIIKGSGFGSAGMLGVIKNYTLKEMKTLAEKNSNTSANNSSYNEIYLRSYDDFKNVYIPSSDGKTNNSTNGTFQYFEYNGGQISMDTKIINSGDVKAKATAPTPVTPTPTTTKTTNSISVNVIRFTTQDASTHSSYDRNPNYCYLIIEINGREITNTSDVKLGKSPVVWGSYNDKKRPVYRYDGSIVEVLFTASNRAIPADLVDGFSRRIDW